MVTLPHHHLRRATHFVLTTEGNGASAYHFNNGEALVSNTLSHNVHQLGYMISGAASYIGRTGSLSQSQQIEAGLDGSVGSSGSLGAFRSHGGVLTAGHTINAVVINNQGQVDIAASSMNQVVAADSGAVTVAAAHDNIQLGVTHFYAGSNGQCTTMQGVGSVEVQIAGATAGAADAADNSYIVLSQTLLINSLYNSAGDNTIAAAGAPDVR